MKLALIIPCYNAAAYLSTLLPVLAEWLGRNTADRELLFVDSSSKDGTADLLTAANLGRVLSVNSADFDHGGTRAWAVEQVSAEVVVLMTQDALPTSADAIDRLVAAFVNPKVGAAFGRQLPYEQCHLFGKHLRYFNYTAQSYVRALSDSPRVGIKTAFLSNSFAAYRRSALLDIGNFKNGLILGEDSYAGGRLLLAGYELAYVAEAQVYHSHSYTIWQEFKRYFDIGVFHAMEPWLLTTFGKPEGEGLRYVKSEFDYLRKQAAWQLLPQFFVRNTMKWLGYKLGKQHKRLPLRFLPMLSMHYRWWSGSSSPCYNSGA
ncbi:glycosyltransferase family 2 protein [Oceanisphaera sp. IT1-181]|uniref:glycosyltransferase family 2 protein n=1 Tax=Oceanisphaera sp. IT1-181 TaxID=3081199 RepID=UPI0029C9D614|nr:glycosyltransferase [Oceanisphaera sp. IT1-181]